MKKEIYYRAIKNKNGFTFKADTGYIINFHNGSIDIDLAFGKNEFNRWTITEVTTGFLVHNSSFNTRKEAIFEITHDYIKRIIQQMQRWQFYPDAVQRLQEYKKSL